MPALYIPDIRLETYGRYYLYEIGFLTVAGGLSMAWFQWKLNLWIWCSGVWPMNCFGRTGVTLGALLWGDQDQDQRSEITRIMVDQNNELINFCPEWSHHCINFDLLACEQALLFGRVKRVSRERASEWQSREGPFARAFSRGSLCLPK